MFFCFVVIYITGIDYVLIDLSALYEQPATEHNRDTDDASNTPTHMHICTKVVETLCDKSDTDTQFLCVCVCLLC